MFSALYPDGCPCCLDDGRLYFYYKPADLCARHAVYLVSHKKRLSAHWDAIMRAGKDRWMFGYRITAVCEWMLRVVYSDESHSDANYRFRREQVLRKRLVASHRRYARRYVDKLTNTSMSTH